VSDYGLDDRVIGRSGFDPRRGQRIFLLASVSRPALGPTQPPVQWVPVVLSPGVKARPGRDADHSPPSSAEVVNESELYLLSPPSASMACSGTALIKSEGKRKLILAVSGRGRCVFKGNKNPQHVSLWRGNEAVGSM
jgi:hypothetical protein